MARGLHLITTPSGLPIADAGITFIRPTFVKEPPSPHQRFLRPFRQIIESVNQTLKAQLDLERHGARTKPGVRTRVLQRLLALTAAIWHNGRRRRPRRPFHSLALMYLPDTSAPQLRPGRWVLDHGRWLEQ